METNSSTALPARRGPGRLKGAPRVPGSGRQIGTPNRITSEIRELIVDKYRPAEFLGKIVLGRKVRIGPQAGPDATYAYPSLQQRMDAARILIGKVLPDLKSNEVTGAEGAPLIPAPPPVDEDALKAALIVMWREATK